MIECRDCKIYLADDEVYCPLCHRKLGLPRRAMVAGLVVLIAVLGIALYGSAKIKNRLDRLQARPDSIYGLVQSYVAKEPAFQHAVRFSTRKESMMERSDAGHWRVSGFVETIDGAGVTVHTVYSCLVERRGFGHWGVRDLQVLEVEHPAGSNPKP